MFNKIADWIYKFKVWISNKNPSNKYLRIAYYFLTGMILFMFAILLALIVATFFIILIIALALLLAHLLLNFSFVRIVMTLLICLMFLLTFSLIGYFAFGDD